MIGISLGIMGRRAAGGAPAYLLRDTFTDANGTALSAHTMDVGGGWSFAAGTYQVSGNKAVKTTADGSFSAAWADAGAADVVAQVVVTSTRTSDYWGGMCLRLTDESNYWLLRFYNGGPAFNLYEMVAGVATLRATASYTADPGDHTIRAVCEGASITCTVDGANEISYGSATFQQSATEFGIVALTTSDESYDDFEVTAA